MLTVWVLHETIGMKGRTSDHAIDSVRRPLGTEDCSSRRNGLMHVESLLSRPGFFGRCCVLGTFFHAFAPFSVTVTNTLRTYSFSTSASFCSCSGRIPLKEIKPHNSISEDGDCLVKKSNYYDWFSVAR